MKDCPFCPPRLAEMPVVLENDLCLFIDLGHGVLQGSGIIIPRTHRESVFDLTPEEIAATFNLLAEAKRLLDAGLAPDGYNVGWNAGLVAGQEVPHAHLHVIPRFDDEPYAGRGIRYWLKSEENKRPRLRQHAWD